jgi:FAD/FMN-containing dehydrogenase
MKLDEIFPVNCISFSEEDLTVYSRDASPYEGKCRAVVWPTNTEQIYNLVHYAKRNQVKLTIRGAATSTYGGCVPSESIVVDMSKMNKVVRIDPDTVVVQAGCTIDDLNRILGKRKKYFPIVPVEHKVCTIGGMVATNCFGLDRFYGRMDAWVTGLEIVDGTGKRLTLGAVPSTAFLGSEGTFGIICSIKLKIIQRAQYKTYSLFKFNTITAMMDKVKELKRNQHVLSINYFDDYASKMLKLENLMHLMVEYDDEQGTIQDKEELLRVTEMKEQVHHLLVKRKFSTKEDVLVPEEHIPKFLHWLRQNGVPVLGYLTENIIHACFRDYSKMPVEMRGIVERLKGKVAVEFPIGLARKDMLEKQKEEKLRIFKNQYDNMKIMNRGVLVD